MLKRLEVENFGPFRGRHYLNLEISNAPGVCRPIILIGGKNGTGKTTLFEAIKLCLYGRFFKGKKLSEKAYMKYIDQKIHRSIDGTPAHHASITIEFAHAKLGHINNYFIKRTWERSSYNIIEKLMVEKDGKILEDVDEDQWQEFLMQLVPLGISKFFFFDGEQIQKLAKEKHENNYFFNSINSLLGLEIVERLRSDLEIYASRKIKSIDDQVETKVQDYIKRKNDLEKRLTNLLERKKLLKEKINKIQMTIEGQELKIALEGGSFASKREKLRSQKKEVDEKIESVKEQIRDLCSNLLPFAYVPDLCCSLKKRLEQEEREEQKIAAISLLNATLDKLSSELEHSSVWDLLKVPLDKRPYVLKIFLTELKNKLELINVSNGEIIHQLSSFERKEMRMWIDEILYNVPLQLAKLTVQLEKLIRERQKIEKFLFSVPPDDVVHPLFRRLRELYEKLGRNQAKLSSLEEKEQRIKNELNQVNRELKKKLEEKARNEKIYEKLNLLKSVQNALSDYLNNIRAKKINEFRENFLECFNVLFNKKHFISNVDIDLDSFNIKLINNNNIIPTNVLSAGERQIYAISLCWALARTSGRPIPFIIDTPLGRLDREHRRNVIENFFSKASHQVIIFSTDTEIDTATFEVLKNYVSRVYRLEYYENEKSTHVKEGYFCDNSLEVINR